MKKFLEHRDIVTHIDTIANQINDAYRGEKVVVVPVLWGASLFVMELFRTLRIDMIIRPVWTATYSADRGVTIAHDWEPPSNPADYSVLVIDAIINTGETYDKILTMLADFGFRDADACFLLDTKKSGHVGNYSSLDVSGKFVIGFGMDLKGKYRGLSDIWECGDGPSPGFPDYDGQVELPLGDWKLTLSPQVTESK